MLECLIIGDSIAVGTHQARPECVAYAKVGWNTQQWNRDYLKNNLSAKAVIISLGANDHAGVRTKAELQRIREKVGTTARVFWISPGAERKPVAQAAIEQIAREYGDTVLPRPRDHMSADGIHPTGQGYKQIANATRKVN